MKTSSKPRSRRLIWYVIIAIAAAWIGIRFQQQAATTTTVATAETVTNATTLENGTLLSRGRAVTPFTLTDEQGKAFTENELRGKWTFVYFGFTHCPHICPTALTVMNKAYQSMEKDKNTEDTQMMLVSVDPERDTTDVLANYIVAFNQHFKAANSSAEELEKLTKQLGVVYMKVPAQQSSHHHGSHEMDENDYMVEHSNTIMLINPKGELQAVFTAPFDGETIARDFAKIRHMG
jgi:protein SCO1/2